MPVTPFVPAPSTVNCRIIGSLYGDTIINNINVKKIGGGLLPADYDAIGARITTWMSATFLPLITVDYTWTGLVLRDLGVPNGTVINYGGTGEPGGLAGQGLPGNVTCSVAFYNAFSFPGGKFGVRVSGLIEANVTGNTISNLWRGSLGTAFNTLKAGIEAGGTYWFATVSKYTGKLPRGEAFVAPVVNISIPTTRVHTMGKRVNGR